MAEREDGWKKVFRVENEGTLLSRTVCFGLSLLTMLVGAGCATPPSAPAPTRATTHLSTRINGQELAAPQAQSFASRSSCTTVQNLQNGHRIRFRMGATWAGGENNSVERVRHYAINKALRRVLRCSGRESVILSLFDKRAQLGKKSEQTIESDLYTIVSSMAKYEVAKDPCQMKESGALVCHVVLSGTLRIEDPDPGFEIRLDPGGIRGTYLEGERVTVKFHLTEAANVYLFDVDEEGNAYLLFPNRKDDTARNPVEAGQPVVFPGPNSPVLLEAYLPGGKPRALEHIYIVAVRGEELLTPAGTTEKKVRMGDLFQAGNFRKNVMGRLFDIPRARWTMKDVGFGIERLPQ